ncbi:MAG: sulfurtransferase TusA family protein [Lautropia sp.]|nr:sulfurtransferase TusA family protein [Lautropia sp.]
MAEPADAPRETVTGGADLPTPDVVVDARNMNCPLPILKAKKALAGMDSGQILRVEATDPGSKQDFAAFCRQTGNALLAQLDEAEVSVFFLRRR